MVRYYNGLSGCERVRGFSGLYCVCIIALFLVACGTSGGSDASLSYGGITFSLVAPAEDAESILYRSEGFPCEQYDIVGVEAEVLDARGDLVTSGGPWDCNGGRGTIGFIRAGENYTLWVYLRNSAGQIRYQGSVGGLRVRMGRITNAQVALHRINFTPVFEEIDVQETRAGQNLTFLVSASDPDGDPVIITARELPPGASFDTLTGRFSWTPANNQVGRFSAWFLVTDTLDDTQAEVLEVTIFVTGPNLPPGFTPLGGRTVQEGQAVKFSVRATDPDGDAVSLNAPLLPPGASFNPGSGAFSWRPSYDQAGTYTIRFTATDSSNPPQTAIMDVTVTVLNTNRSPVLRVPSDIQRVTPAGTLVFQVSASDPDGNALVLSAADLPRSPAGIYFPRVGFDEASGIFRWEAPGVSAVGEYRVLFTVMDNGNPPRRDYRYVTIQVYDDDNPIEHRRHPVLLEIGPRSVSVGSFLEIAARAWDPDYPDGGEFDLVYTVEEVPGRPYPAGSFFDPLDGLFTWQALSAGNYWVRFVVTDPNDTPLPLSDREDVVITVGNVNRPPALDPIGRRIVQYGDTLQFTIFATDPDGDSLTYSASDLPPGAVFDPDTRTFTWRPGYSSKTLSTRCIPPRTYIVRFMVTDSGAPRESDWEDVEITVLFE